MNRTLLTGLFMLIAAVLVSCGGEKTEDGGKKPTFTMGYFPNVTHAQALVGIQRGDFEKALGPDVAFKAVPFNAGPSVIEAIYAGQLDVAYVGPSPAINGFLKSDGKEVRLIAGSAENGIVIVGNKKRGIAKLEDLKGKKIATPQLANTQDISARHYITAKLGSKLGRGAGETEVIPVANPDTMNLFEKDQLDAAWLPEPWASRLEEAGLVVVIAEEKDLWESGRFALTSVVARAEFLEKHPDLVGKFLEAHIRITDELADDSARFVPEINAQIEKVSGKKLAESVLEKSLARCRFTVEPDLTSFERFFQKGKELGFYTQPVFDVKRLLVDGPLHEAQTRIEKAADTP
ncbi:PhnD/SsuA/transferrin family substrate-binding protein [bacterium]|nr:PhnD/SsuA/transferrin family substrate-binding protein [bacterium]